MTQNELALKLVETVEQAELFEQNFDIADTELAFCLKNLCLESWTNNPPRSVRAADALKLLAGFNENLEIAAFSAWTQGIAWMIGGEMKRAVKSFDLAEKLFQKLEKNIIAAETQVAKLYPMAMLGQYDEAVEIGLKAREIFLQAEDFTTVGKIELNVGNIYQRTDRFSEAEHFLRLARERFIALENYKLLTQITNSLAFLLAHQYRFREAETFYYEALKNAEQAEMFVTKAEIESSLGQFSLAYGRYDQALKFAERARIGYTKLEMPHESAIVEKEMADAYTELNLFAEASAIYEKIIPVFAEFEMPLERAHALINLGRVQFALKNHKKAAALLNEAQKLFAQCGSQIGEATAFLSQSQILAADGNFAEAAEILENAKIPLAEAGIVGTKLLADVFHAEILSKTGAGDSAEAELKKSLAGAEINRLPQISVRCLTALGKLAKGRGDFIAAEDHFQKAIEITEVLRAPLPAEDFRGAFFADKLAPYHELIKLFLNDASRIEKAFEYLEKSRSKVLLEVIQTARNAENLSGSAASETDELRQELADLREELNWLYNEINRFTAQKRTLREMRKLQTEAIERETVIAETMRRINLSATPSNPETRPQFDLAKLQKGLGTKTVLLEFAEFDGEFSVFAVSGNNLKAFPNLFHQDELRNLLTKFHFQIDTLRSNPAHLKPFLGELSQRTRRVLGELYDLILRPLESEIGLRRLVISADTTLNYVPFHALFDGFDYLIERREIVYSPSAAILQNCLNKPRRTIEKPMLLGFPDKRIPLVRDEIYSLKQIFPTAEVFLDEAASSARLREKNSSNDVLHLACHGQFRADNPLFSSLCLADGWLTVRDLSGLKLDCELAVLSACETGISEISAGNELLGLARGFFSAGANSLLVSLWNVHDATTVEFMKIFYTQLKKGNFPAQALRRAQRQIMKSQPHPFFWSPFFLIGRW